MAVAEDSSLNFDCQLLKDLSTLCELFSMLHKRLLSTPQYVGPICQLVQLCGMPFLKEKASDENNYATHVLQTLSLLSTLALTGVNNIITAVAKAIASFYSMDPNLALLEGKGSILTESKCLICACVRVCAYPCVYVRATDDESIFQCCSIGEKWSGKVISFGK